MYLQKYAIIYIYIKIETKDGTRLLCLANFHICINVFTNIFIYIYMYIHICNCFYHRKIETKDGTRLLCLADFHLGSDATLMLSHSLLMAPALQQPPLPPNPPPMVIYVYKFVYTYLFLYMYIYIYIYIYIHVYSYGSYFTTATSPS
jgi:hypothetical protein